MQQGQRVSLQLLLHRGLHGHGPPAAGMTTTSQGWPFSQDGSAQSSMVRKLGCTEAIKIFPRFKAFMVPDDGPIK
jgi:hypothetical protein